MKTFCTLLKNEMKLNIRNMNMVIFAVILPLVVLVILGFLYGASPAADGVDYTFLEQSIGALCAISICAGGLMGLPLVVAEYRERKILKRFQVTPISPGMLLVVEFLIYVLYALVSLITLLLLSRLAWGVQLRGSWAGFFGSWLLTIFSTLSIGMMVGGIAKNAKSASVIACVLYFPMLIFSGATLPFEVMPEVMQKIISVFPLTQGIQLMQTTFLGLTVEQAIFPVIVMLCVTVVCSGIAVKCFKWE
ncbi:MAG: ABC transporter permease [Clostridiales bacterium]|jgi:ABC-2 type transport system permease protein|nr:ABC transporter permease [Clostridiales bacterium]